MTGMEGGQGSKSLLLRRGLFLPWQSELNPRQRGHFGDLAVSIIRFVSPLQNGPPRRIPEPLISAHYIEHGHTTVCADKNSEYDVAFDSGSFGIRGVYRRYLFQ
jgi:hypothetical protein